MVIKRDFCGEEEYLIDSGTLQVSIMALGATVTGISLEGRQLLLRYGTAMEYLEGSAYIGALVGRYANRIGGASFILNGKVLYSLALPALAFSTLGGWVGSRLAVRRGAKFIRYVMLGVMGLIIVKLAYEWFA